jgi:hypothetical protein
LSEWWTYRPSDFLMFSARSYGRLVESYNHDLWPLQLLMIAAGLALAWLTLRPPAPGRRLGSSAVALALAAVWLWVGWAFHWQRFAQINIVAVYLAWAFFAQAALLVLLAFKRPDGAAEASARVRDVGVAICVAAVLIYPLLAPLMGRPWAQAEVFGAMPEPTALATTGILLASRQRYRFVLLVIPILTLSVGATTAALLWAR